MGRIPADTPSKSVVKRGLKHLQPIHKTIAWMLATGSRQCDIARQLGFNQSRLSLIVNSPIFQDEVRRLEKERDTVFVNYGLKEARTELAILRTILMHYTDVD